MKILLLDYGATQIKAAILEAASGEFEFLRAYRTVTMMRGREKYVEFDLEKIKEQFLLICNYYWEGLNVHFERIFICSEMHGFAVVDEKLQPITPYISWKDERSASVNAQGKSAFEKIKAHIPEYRTITGMEPRPGLPFMNLYHMAVEGELPNKARIVTLPEWLACCDGEFFGRVDETMLAGLGVYDIRQKAVSKHLLGFLKHQDIVFGEVVPVGESAGVWNKDGYKISIHTGVGDHPCAVLGAGNKIGETLSINIGTGSQISIITNKVLGDTCEYRPFFGGDILATITHIPAGRAIAEHIRFLHSIGKVVGGDCGEDVYWKLLDAVRIGEVEKATLRMDLAMFTSAWNYQNGAKIENIAEGNLILQNYLASLIKSLAEQYLQALPLLPQAVTLADVVLSGGLARKVPVLQEYFKKMTGKRVFSAREIDETLLGLRTIFLLTEKRISSWQEGDQYFT